MVSEQLDPDRLLPDVDYMQPTIKDSERSLLQIHIHILSRGNLVYRSNQKEGFTMGLHLVKDFLIKSKNLKAFDFFHYLKVLFRLGNPEKIGIIYHPNDPKSLIASINYNNNTITKKSKILCVLDYLSFYIRQTQPYTHELSTNQIGHFYRLIPMYYRDMIQKYKTSKQIKKYGELCHLELIYNDSGYPIIIHYNGERGLNKIYKKHTIRVQDIQKTSLSGFDVKEIQQTVTDIIGQYYEYMSREKIDCPICLDEIVGNLHEMAYQLDTCKHIFCKKCMHQLIDNDNNNGGSSLRFQLRSQSCICPLCRMEFYQNDLLPCNINNNNNNNNKSKKERKKEQKKFKKKGKERKLRDVKQSIRKFLLSKDFTPLNMMIVKGLGINRIIRELINKNLLRRLSTGSKLLFAFEDFITPNREEAESNKNGIVISDLLHFDKMTVLPETEINIPIKVKNTCMYRHHDLIKVYSLPNGNNKINKVFSIDNGPRTMGKPIPLAPNEEIEMVLTFKSNHLGKFKNIFFFEFDQFAIARYCEISVIGDNELRQYLKPSKAYRRPVRIERGGSNNNDNEDNGIMNGGQIISDVEETKPQFLKNLKFKVPLDAYMIPEGFKTLVARGILEEKLLKLSKKVSILSMMEDDGGEDDDDGENASIDNDFESNDNNDIINNNNNNNNNDDNVACSDLDNYKALFRQLLWAEEMQLNYDMKSFDIEDAKVTMKTSLASIRVPGLAEKRPSLLKGDAVYAIDPDDPKNRKWKGFIWDINLLDIAVKFPKALNLITGKTLKITFEFRRTGLRIQHQALEKLTEYFFDAVINPSSSMNELNEPLVSFENANQIDRTLNNEQMKAVSCIVEGKSKKHPFLIFGPPGTGKTVTMVEAIKQVYKKRSSSKILVVAPSNTAADLLVKRLGVSIGESEMIRIMAQNRNKSEVEDDVLRFCKYNHSLKCFEFDTALENYRIVVGTCSTAGKLRNNGVTENHFDICFVDEAAQAFEPDILGSLVGIVNPETCQIILAGDPKQLGPVVRHNIANQCGLGVSMLERLMSKCTLYARDISKFPDSCGYNPDYIVKLLHCYRSHPAIIKVSNDLFYNGELIPSADPLIAEGMLNWEHLPNGNFPVIFHGVEGENEREASSPSWFNTTECEIVVDYCIKLKNVRGKGLTLQDVAIVTPYQRQASKLRRALELKDCHGVTVGTTESLQGQERRVVIISTVRSSTEYLELDEKYDLGFIGNDKRFNVALTRAQSLMIVVGSPTVLQESSCWNTFIKHCMKANAYTGSSPPPSLMDLVDIDADVDDDGDDSGNNSKKKETIQSCYDKLMSKIKINDENSNTDNNTSDRSDWLVL